MSETHERPAAIVEIPVSGGVTLTADHWPGDGPAVVLAHGGGQTRHSWGATAAVLASEGHEVVSLDLRGHGDSGWATDGDYSTAAFARDAIEVVRWIGRPVVWVGASLGGSTGLLYSSWPEANLLALVLVDIVPNPSPTGVDRIIGFMSANLEEGFATLQDAADAIAKYQPHRPKRTDLSGLEKNLRQRNGRWFWHWDPSFIQPRQSEHAPRVPAGALDDAARALRIPTLLVRGLKSDLVTEETVDEFRALVPHAHFVNIPDAAHMVAGDKNDIFSEAVVDFIQQLDTAAS